MAHVMRKNKSREKRRSKTTKVAHTDSEKTARGKQYRGKGTTAEAGRDGDGSREQTLYPSFLTPQPTDSPANALVLGTEETYVDPGGDSDELQPDHPNKRILEDTLAHTHTHVQAYIRKALVTT